jgi:alpha-N-arabinofuranosidase
MPEMVCYIRLRQSLPDGVTQGEASAMLEVKVIVDDQPIGIISPRLYGHFAEHLGRCCYGGLWLGPDAGAAQTEGFRSDVLAALRELGVTMIRWPGGCYADHYHWRNGIGAPAMRPTTLGMSCGEQVPDDNSLGTHEFLRLCEILGAEPYLAGNLGTGSVQELCDWIEYVNASVTTTLTRERAANGRQTPWDVRLWGIGNESWGCGGRFDPVAYAHEYRRHAAMVRHVDPGAELVAVGMEDDGLPEMGMDPAWNAKFLEALGPDIDLVDHLSVHRYWVHGGPEETFDESDYYALLDEADGTERLIERTSRLLAGAAKPGHPISVALDEWGVWHPEARDWGPGDVARRQPATFEQANTLRDALAAGAAFEGFHRQCRVLSMANVAQIVNVLQSVLVTEGPVCVRTPTYHAFALHKPHIGSEALRVEVEPSGHESAGQPAMSATASTRDDGVAVTLINRDYRRPVVANISVAGIVSSSWVLSADSPHAANSPTDPERVAPRILAVESQGSRSHRTTLPPHSLATVQFAARGAEGQ